MLKHKDPVRTRLTVRTTRQATGGAVLTIMIIIGLIVLPALGLIGFELVRFNAAKDQLRGACEAAALAGAAQLAMADSADLSTARTEAAEAAAVYFKRNIVFKQPLANAQQVISTASHAAVPPLFKDGQSSVAISFESPESRRLIVDAGIMLKPAFGQYLGLGAFPIYASAKSGLPKLDVALLFDISSSMDDSTQVTFVTRRWDKVNNKIEYVVNESVDSPGFGREGDIVGNGSGPLGADLANGSAKGCIPPQALSWQAPDVDGKERFVSLALRSHSTHSSARFAHGGSCNYHTPAKIVPAGAPADYPVLAGEEAADQERSSDEPGRPPGNFFLPGETEPHPVLPASFGGPDPATNPMAFTDLLVNLNGSNRFEAITVDGYSFPNVGTLVEAARGNLENETVFHSSVACTGEANQVSPRPGYQQAYLKAAKKLIEPMRSAQIAAKDFINTLNINADVNVHFVPFGATSNSVDTESRKGFLVARGNTPTDAAPEYAPDGKRLFRAKHPVFDRTNITQAQMDTLIDPIVSGGGTGFAEPIQKAVAILERRRPGARPIIVLFTDGCPTFNLAGSFDVNAAVPHAIREAEAAKSKNIPIYCVGLAQNKALVQRMTNVLNDNIDRTFSFPEIDHPVKPVSLGIAGTAAPGGKFFLVSDSGKLKDSFQAIARSLVRLAP